MFVTKKTKVIEIPMFNVWFYLLDTEKKYKHFIEENNLDVAPEWHREGGFVYQYGTPGGDYFVMGLGEDVPDDVIVHEAVHMAQFGLDHVNVGIGVDNSEVMCYVTQYIFKKAREAINKRRKKNA